MSNIVSREVLQEARGYFSAGASAHFVALKIQIPYDVSVKLQAEYAEDLRKQSANNRLVLRNAFREQIASALATMVRIHQATADGFKELEYDKKKIDIMNLRLNAAKSIISAGQKFIDDDLINLHTEKPQEADSVQTIFDYESIVSDDGSTILKITPAEIDDPLFDENEQNV
jgi:hypothetical protein